MVYQYWGAHHAAIWVRNLHLAAFDVGTLPFSTELIRLAAHLRIS